MARAMAEAELSPAIPLDQDNAGSEVKYERNERVAVRYANGVVKKDVKFKKVEAEVRAGLCFIVGRKSV